MAAWWGMRLLAGSILEVMEEDDQKRKPSNRKKRSRPKPSTDLSELPYELHKSLLTPTERRFAKALFTSTPDALYVMVKVRMEDVIGVPKNMEYRDRQSLRGRVKSRHFDFVICRRECFTPLVAIELDDRSHTKKSNYENDEIKNDICHAADFPIIRVKTNHQYSNQRISAMLEKYV